MGMPVMTCLPCHFWNYYYYDRLNNPATETTRESFSVTLDEKPEEACYNKSCLSGDKFPDCGRAMLDDDVVVLEKLHPSLCWSGPTRFVSSRRTMTLPTRNIMQIWRLPLGFECDTSQGWCRQRGWLGSDKTQVGFLIEYGWDGKNTLKRMQKNSTAN